MPGGKPGRSGGARKGAGRPKGSLTQKTVDIARKAAAEGITPLEVIINTMRARWEKDDIDGALEAAVHAAPYMHPRLQSIEQKLDANVTQRIVSDKPITDDEWEAKYGDHLGAAVGAASVVN